MPLKNQGVNPMVSSKGQVVGYLDYAGIKLRSTKFQHHKNTVRISDIAAEGWTLNKPVLSIKFASRIEIRPRAGLKTQPRQSHLARRHDNVPQHRAPGAFPPVRPLGVH
jgi:hypothetical protein